MPGKTEELDGKRRLKARQSAVVRFAGDSGDGMQLAGTQFTDTSAIVGNDVATLPDYPAEIRAPAGTVAGVSGFQINFSSEDIYTPGDKVDALIAMNPAALKAHIPEVKREGIVVVNESEFTKTNLKKAGYPAGHNPLEDEVFLESYQVMSVPITRLNEESLAESGMGAKDIGRCKNMFALGIIYWLYNRPLETTERYITNYFAEKKNKPEVAEANIKALRSGYYFGETAELFTERYQINRADITPGQYRKVVGNEALAMGLVTASKLSKRELVYCSYPITPASTVLHALAGLRHFGVKTFQAEDEIAAVCGAIGVSYAGGLGVTGTSGPGLALKSEAIGLAVMTELPLVIVNVQRGGPSTGLPTKTEQSDLLQTLWGRNGDCPVVVIAPKSPADCFDAAIEASRIAMTHTVPVVLLTDGYLANGSEPWPVPKAEELEPIVVPDAPKLEEDAIFAPYDRDPETLARPWVSPGVKGYEHRIGGLEKQNITGNVNYDPENHQMMTAVRKEKVDRIANVIPPIEPFGSASGELLIVGWGGTYGSIHTAVESQREKGRDVSSIHLRHMNPMPSNLSEVLKRFKHVLVPELNTGQLRLLLRSKYLVDARGLNKVQGKPFLVEEIEQAIELMLEDGFGDHEYLMPRNHAVSTSDQNYDFMTKDGRAE
ncbi:2-oxoacid:acceptor oxidoreductase subunit alpha [Poriferisphaera sp. WC338]|uniref:2-oxoacid:acceptor oxidoreductase subunit alpha n=1 Tax=Poriferisphaera sp. WC338 TaxID=3425129 RepID=UPI003D81AA11